MEGRINPPSSVDRLSEETLARQAASDEIWVVGDPPVASVILTPRDQRLYIGKLCVSAEARRRGLARRLVGLATDRARDLGLPILELQTRVELVENHETFAALGFSETARTAHAGYDRPTSITMQRAISATR